MKVCRDCGAEKAAEEFARNRAMKDGRLNSCRSCRSVAQKRYYAANAESQRARSRAWTAANRERVKARSKARDHAAYREKNRERVRESQRRWRETHREKHNAAGRAYAKAHPERYRAYKKARRQLHPEAFTAEFRRHYERHRQYHAARRRKYADEHPEHNRIAHGRRRQRKLAVGGNGITREQWREILNAYGHRCAYCAAQGELQMEHVEALAAGGAHDASNIVPACRTCNISKCHRPLVIWLRRGGPIAFRKVA